MSTPSPPTSAPLYEQVAEQIRDLISANGLEPGDRLPTERDLAARLSVSRSSVRQALTLLRTMGLVQARQGDGIYVQRPPESIGTEISAQAAAAQASLPQIMEVREALETYLARLAARRRSRRDVQELERAVAALASAIARGEDPAPADAQFHAGVARAADSPMVEGLMQQLAGPIARTRAASLSRPGRPPRSLEGHRRILAAIADRNEEGASAAMREHLTLVADVAYDAPALPSAAASG